LPTLRPPATRAALQQVEKAIGQRLPDDVRESYRIHDGQNEGAEENQPVPGVFFGMRPLPLAEERGVEWCWRQHVVFLPEKIGEEDPEVRGNFMSFPPDAIRLARMRAGWIPLYWDSDRNFFGIDLDPGPRGVKGQVIPFSHG